MQMISQDTKVEPDDVVLTSGLGGAFPPDLLVGQVVSLHQRQSDLFQQATVQPVVDFSNLEIVLVIIDFRPVDITPLLPTPVP
jgi:rod shape-determining protein MreC